MAIVAGVDFGALSVRVTLLDSNHGRLGTAVADYPLHRKLYFALGSPNSDATALGDVLPQLRHIAHQSNTEG